MLSAGCALWGGYEVVHEHGFRAVLSEVKE